MLYFRIAAVSPSQRQNRLKSKHLLEAGVCFQPQERTVSSLNSSEHKNVQRNIGGGNVENDVFYTREFRAEI